MAKQATRRALVAILRGGGVDLRRIKQHRRAPAATNEQAPPRSPATRAGFCVFTHHPTPAPRQQLPRRRHLQDAGPAFWGDDRIGNLDHLPQLIKRHTEHRCSLSSRNAANILDGAGDH